MKETFDILASIFGFWPLIFLAAFGGALKGRGKFSTVMRRGLSGMLILWGFFAILRLYSLATGQEVVGFLISEPASTSLFFFTGFVLAVLLFGSRILSRYKVKKDLDRVNSTADFQGVSPDYFEEMVAEYFRLQGHRAVVSGSAAGDHGVDVVVRTKNGNKWVVQCKRYKNNVGEPVIRDLMGVIQHEEADLGILMTSGGFTRKAVEWAKNKPIRLVDGKQLLKLTKTVQQKNAVAKQPAANKNQALPKASAAPDVPFCPRCGQPMVLRIAKRGDKAGQKFFGCRNYPQCKEIIPLKDWN